MKLKEKYILANCCQPAEDDLITGYYSHDNFIKVHRSDCPNLAKAETSRLVSLDWPDIIQNDEFIPGDDYSSLDEIDFDILAHHYRMGIDYSLAVAALLNLDDKTVFERHRKLRQMSLLERVEPVMVQYRKNIVKNKWIKHRNHTYYDLTDKGRDYLKYHDHNS
ncbi:hypothetical protein TRIP_C21565 [Candidatus Zixiibacteriota bacterium]|nr:hypothetical protein TRIP_C21565 [candidate division Zixibacteria bacterium]